MEAYHMRIAMQLGSAIPTRFICSHNQKLDNMFDVWQKIHMFVQTSLLE